MKEKKNVIKHLNCWAEERGIETEDDYVKVLENNLFSELDPLTKHDFESASGSELKAKEGEKPKAYALHSSSMLAVNVFDYWRKKDKEAMAKALKIDSIRHFWFEQKLTMGMGGAPPNLDLFIIKNNGFAVAIESKFTEWMSKHSKSEPFAKSYFEDERKRWEEVGLPNAQKLAQKIAHDNEKFHYLNAPQLLKHALGLANTHSSRSQLIYLFYDLEKESEVSKKHHAEISKFRDMLGDELQFHSMTYQEFIKRLNSNFKTKHNEYFDYLNRRYNLTL